MDIAVITTLIRCMVNRLLFYCFIIFYISSCTYSYIPCYIKNEFKYAPKSKGEEDFITFNGIYKELHFKSSTIQKLCSKHYYTFVIDTLLGQKCGAFDVVFLRNGTCTMGYLDEFRKDKLTDSNYKKDRFTNGGSYWGYYEVSSDTVKVKAVQRNTLMAGSTDAFEQWYKIIDTKTLKPIYFRSITKGTCVQNFATGFLIDSVQYPKTRFYEIDENLIKPNFSWLINEKWFWKNKQEYQEWKRKSESNK